MLSDDGMAFGCGCQRSPCRDHHMGVATAQTFGYKKVREKKMDCFGTYFKHAQTCDDVRVQSATQWTAQTCDDVRVQSATQWTASKPH